ncbi:hypothetical protein E1A91_A13G147600v1, partial [Gossypium mustelinum]
MVADLIYEYSRQWKRDKIENTFDEVDANRIMSIPLAKTPHANFLIWRGEPTGVFSVHSAYKQILQKAASSKQLQAQANYNQFYKQLWDLNLP